MKNHACAIVIDGHHTDIALKIYSNRVLAVITQFKKFGTLVVVSRGTVVHELNNRTFSTKVLFGKDDIEVVAAARFITEQIDVDKPVLVSISLKNYDPKTLKAIAKAVNEIKSW
ncbi:proteasome assembly chaperone 3-like [Nomia melanderi]|uniref:proteasome assembly chaperone 3-like n=1 Tax=Nomia melanderi TaxID=2448451 RepID=UPI001304789C|nr:proteasome assembly chaperone 3-like [Nomia melanderi]